MPKNEVHTMIRKIAGRTYSAEVPSQWSDNPDVQDFVINDEDFRKGELAIAAQIAADRPSAAGLTWMRKALGLTGKRAAELLGVRAETVSRWENGAADVDRASWLAIGAVVLEAAGKPVAMLERMDRLAVLQV